MKALALGVLLLWLVSPRAVWADLPGEIEQLTNDLGSPEFAKREAASKRLQEIGTPAVDALRKALANPDPEIRHRAQQLLNGPLRAAALAKAQPSARPPLPRQAPQMMAQPAQNPVIRPAPKLKDGGQNGNASWRNAYALWEKDHSKGREALETIKKAGREMEARLPQLGTNADVEETRAMLFAAMRISAAR
jgi:hypothetical protein